MAESAGAWVSRSLFEFRNTIASRRAQSPCELFPHPARMCKKATPFPKIGPRILPELKQHALEIDVQKTHKENRSPLNPLMGIKLQARRETTGFRYGFCTTPGRRYALGQQIRQKEKRGDRMLNVFHRGSRGFTLIELMIVVVIIGILAALAVPRFMRATTKAKQSEAKQILKQIYTMQRSYRQLYDTYACNGKTMCSA